MAKKYIDAQKLERHFENCIDEVRNINGVTEDFEIALIATKNQPAADVQEVRRGRWISVFGDVIFMCSKCEAEISTSWDYDDDDMFMYCPCCGARMDGESVRKF